MPFVSAVGTFFRFWGSAEAALGLPPSLAEGTVPALALLAGDFRATELFGFEARLSCFGLADARLFAFSVIYHYRSVDWRRCYHAQSAGAQIHFDGIR
jgi:hypothetical protein